MQKILLVDDEPMILRVLSVALTDRGFDVVVANNGQEALEAVNTLTPDAVVTDIDMPRMNGRELCVALREKFHAAELPIFVVTAKTALEHRDWSGLIDNLHFLEKPVSIQMLATRLELALVQRDVQAESAS